VASACLVATIALAGTAAVPGVGGSQEDSAAELRADGAELAARSRSAVLELYGLDSRLASAQARLVSLQARAAVVTSRRATVQRRLGIARQTYAIAERHLAGRLRALYEQDRADPLAVVLGAQSLEEALTVLDGLELAAEQDRAIIAQTRSARVRYRKLASSLRARSSELARLVAGAKAQTTALASARAARAAYVERLAAERRLNAERVAAVEEAAALARERAQALSTETRATAAVAVAPAAVAAGGTRTMVVTASGYALPGATATGVPVGWGVVAVDPSVIPLGTRMTIPGYGTGVASDTGPAVRGASIDLWFPNEAAALAWGRRTVTITLD
jgi:cystine transport system substrate-binding protein